VLVADSHAEAADLLDAADPARVFSLDRLGAAPDAVFMFPGAPAIAPGTARDLYQTEPVFNEWMDRGLDVLGAQAGDDIRALYLAADDRKDAAAARLAAPALREPLTVITGVAMAQLLMSWGVAPAALVGASTGESAAAVVAGVLDFDEAIVIAHLHGRLEQTGPAEARAAVRAELRGFAGNIALKAPGIPLVSGRTGAPMTQAQATSFETWVNTGGDETWLDEAFSTLAARPDRAFLVLAADPEFTARVCGDPELSPARIIQTLPTPENPAPDDVHFVGVLARLWALGLDADWDQFWADAKRHRVPLPGYAFQRSRYLIEPGRTSAEMPTASLDLIRQDDMADWGWRAVWRPAYAACEYDVATELDRAPQGTWLVFEDGEGIAEAVCTRLEGAGHSVVRVVSGDSFAEVGDRRYTLMSEQGREGYEALFAALADKDLMPSRIVHFWGVSPAETYRLGSDPFHDNLEYGFFSLTYLAQALGHADLPSPVHVTAITRDAASVNGGPIACPEKATIAGPAGVMSRELPGVTCSTLDLEPAAPAARKSLFGKRVKPDLDGLALRLLEDLLADPGNETAAYRGERRYTQSYKRVRLEVPEAPAFRDGGTYLVTGGLGDLGLDVARSLVERHAARVILVGRRAMPPRDTWEAVLRRSPPGDRIAAAIRGVQAIEMLDGEIEIAAADVTNLKAMRALVASVTERHSRIDGVIHAAGVLDDGPLMERDAQAMECVFAPKVDGLRVLDELFPDGSTDLMVLFSSTTTATRNAGEVDFAAANEYLNAYAKSRQGGDTRVVAVNWGVWSEIGMVARALDPVDPAKAPGTPVDAPLLGTAAFDQDGVRAFRTSWEAGRAWVLDQHRTGNGTGFMPASGIIELAAEAFAAEGGEMPFEIRNLQLSRPFLAANRTPHSAVRIKPAGATWHFEMQSDATVEGKSARVSHAEAQLVRLDVKAPPPVDLAAVAIRCHRGSHEVAAPGEHLRAPQHAQLDLGPAWQGLRESALGTAEGLARLELPDAAQGTRAPGMILHPGLLDLAMTWAVELAPNVTTGSLWLPDSCGSIRVYGPLGGEVASWVRLTEGDSPIDVAQFEVTLCDLQGNVLVEIGNLRVKRVDPETGLAPAPLTATDVTFPETGTPHHKRTAIEAQLAWNVSQGIRPGEGLEALERSIALDLPQVMVTSLDLAGLIAEADRAEPVAVSGGQTFDRPDLATPYVEPETEVEQALAAEWSKLLGIARVGIDDDFFDLGGHSLIAVRLCANVNKTYGTDFGLAVLAEAPTIREWAQRIDALTAPGSDAGATESRPAFTHIVPLNRSRQTRATPVFLVSGMFGNVLNLRHVAQILGEDRPVYGLQAKGLLGDDEPCHTFEEAAASCLAEMRQIQPEGPYLVGGFSGGGITALEIARQVEAAGDQAALVVMFDTYKDHDPVIKRIDKVFIKLAEFRRKGAAYVFEWAKNRIAWEFQKRRKDEAAPEGAFHNYRIEMAFRDAIHAYEPKQYDMNVVLLRPALDKYYKVSRGNWITSEKRYVSEDNQWGEHIPKLEVVEMPGDHGSMVLVPNVGVVGTYLRARIDAALESPGEIVQWDAREAAE
jgi:thioesterase domain-containing protein/NAD(P)-dependent dehydrogenase (short-subunit alcohol dehydrogenase family)/aryl carrier-like protein